MMITKVISKVRLSNPYFPKESDISEVQLKDGTIEPVDTVMNNIALRLANYVVDDFHFPKSRVDVVNNLFGKNYIRTVRDSTTNNNLLSLPRF